MDLWKRFSKFPSAGRDNIEKMLNFIQQCAWMFNDVAKSLKNAGFSEKDVVEMGILSEKNKEMKELNEKARDMKMFKEFQINDLIKDAKLTKNGSFNGGKVKKFPEKWGSEKIGFQGWHGVKNDERVSSKPIGKIKEGKDVLQNGLLFKEFEINGRFTSDIKGSVVPDEMFGAVKDILSARGG